jgi:hypothetical protein
MTDAKPCTHGVTFDEGEAKRVLGDWQPRNGPEFIAGNPRSAEVRKLWPRLHGLCPLGCGFNGISYVSDEHYVAGDW